MRSKWQLFRVGVGVIALGLAALGWLGNRTKLGTKLAISNVENVHYSGSATEQDAHALGQALKQIGYFDGQDKTDVLLKKGDEGTVVSFAVIDGAWNDPVIVAGYEMHGRRIAAAMDGPPLTVQLIDSDLKTQKSMQVDVAEWRLDHTPQEIIWYRTGVTEEEAKVLGKSLQDAGYFDNTAPATVVYQQTAGAKEVSFVMPDGNWENQELVDHLTALAQQIKPMLGGTSLTVHLLDANFILHKTLNIQ